MGAVAAGGGIALAGMGGGRVAAQTAVTVTGLVVPAIAPLSVVGLRGTPHLWFADEDGVLHWGGDTNGILGREVDWSKRTDVEIDTLWELPRADPWLSAGLVKIGDPIYLAKWEVNWEQPRLLQIRTIADVELFGIDANNYGDLVFDKARWEELYGFTTDLLSKGALASTPAASRPRLPLPSTLTNLVANGSFESGGIEPDAWRRVGASWATLVWEGGVAATGERCVAVGGATYSPTGVRMTLGWALRDRVSVEGRARYMIAAQVKCAVAPDANTGNVRVDVTWFNGIGVAIRTSSLAQRPGLDWRLARVAVTAPAEARTAAVQAVYVSVNSADKNRVHVDDVFLGKMG